MRSIRRKGCLRRRVNPKLFMKSPEINLFTCLGVASCSARACLGMASLRSQILPVLIAGLGLLLPGRVTGANFTILRSFTNSDGAYPQAGLILSGNILYGTASQGGSLGDGTIFKMNTDGTGFTNVYSFPGLVNGTNADGANPLAGLVLSGNTLYGTANGGGSESGFVNFGTVFAVNTNGLGFTTLHNFAGGSDGANPQAGLVLSNNTLYGTTTAGGNDGNGTLFKVGTDGLHYTNLYSFTATDPDTSTNTDGADPQAGLVLSGGTLYGTAQYGGNSGNGTIFAISTNGTRFTNLYSFSGLYFGTNSDGALPLAGLILSGNTLYGTASYGGSLGNGTVFSIKTDGTGFTNFYNFTGGFTQGAIPQAGLVLSGNTLYGTTSQGGTGGGTGTAFAVNTDGTSFTNLYNFQNGYGGVDPLAGLVLSGSTLYGTANQGADSLSYNYGTVFRIVLATASAPLLAIRLSGSNVILTWTNTASGFTLLFSPNLVPPGVWGTNTPVPVVVNGQYTVTNSISGTQKFYRLIQ